MKTLIASLLSLAAIVASVESFLFDHPEWNDLRVTWGLNPLTKFTKQPRTVDDAKDQGFTLVGSSTCDGSGVYNGFAYAKNDDYSATLLYDINGYIAGIQLGITKQAAKDSGYPSEKLQPPFNLVHDRYVITAYFVDPSKICTDGRSKQSFDVEGTGTNLWLQNGTTPTEAVRVPKHQSDLATTKWTEGKCFVTMGKHYWYNVQPDMECESFFPVFLLYNGGELNGFGWALFADLNSDKFEHPAVSVIGSFMKKIPKCTSSIKTRLSTMHIYLTSTPLLNMC
ncbi:hypothetical protein RRG08_015692 [Elysia crispata]|uniref:Uncharacterized protein n=1 Tax=Elysia crispata TaxID=231223 RepID=A0AAE1CRN4_9GAST|nr:hypothetical protein RRG08_015692 [Elysia crispata]